MYIPRAVGPSCRSPPMDFDHPWNFRVQDSGFDHPWISEQAWALATTVFLEGFGFRLVACGA